MNAGLAGMAWTLVMASSSVASGLGLAGRSKPIWLSEICRKLSPAPWAWALPSKADDGTPPDTVHNTPVPAQSMHSSAPRRSTVKVSAKVLALSSFALVMVVSRAKYRPGNNHVAADRQERGRPLEIPGFPG